MTGPGTARADDLAPRRASARLPEGATFALLVGIGAALAAAILCFSFERPWTLRGDNKLWFYPVTFEVFRQWMQGHVPVWSSGIWSGFPLLADPQSGTFYLLHWLPYWLTPHPHLRALDLSTALHAGILASGTVRLLTLLGASRGPALLAAVLTLLAPHVLWWTSFLPPFVALSWWPWVLVCAERVARAELLPLRAVVLGSATLAAQAFSGYLEFAFYSAAIAGLWILTAPSSHSLAARTGRVLLLGLATLLLSAPQLVPAALELPRSVRSAAPHQLAFMGVGLESPLSLFDPRPGAASAGWSSAFVGLATLVLAACAVLRRAPRSWFLLLLAIAATLVALGAAAPFHGWLAEIPPFRFFRQPFKLFLVSQLALIWLAALGLQRLPTPPGGRGRWLAALLAGLAVGEYVLQARLQLPRLGPHTAWETPLPEGLASLEPLLPELTRSTDGVGPPPRVFRAEGYGSFGSLGLLVGIETLRGHDLTLLGRRHARLLAPKVSERFDWMTRPRLDLYGVQLVLVPGECSSFDGRGLEVVQRGPDLCLLRNPSWPARYELRSAARSVGSEQEMLRRVLARPSDPIPVLVADDEIRLPPDAWPAKGEVRVLSHRPGRVRLHVETPRDGLLLVRESWNPGWQPELDGRPVAFHPAAGLFFVVPVPAGEHELRLRYRPPGFQAGLVAAAGWLLLAGWAAVRPSNRRSSPGARRSPASDDVLVDRASRS